MILKMKLSLVNISDGKTADNFIAVLAAVIFFEGILLSIYRLFPDYWQPLINSVYNQYNLTAVIIDILVILISVGVTQQVYSYFIGNSVWNIYYFIGIFIIWQIMRLIGFYIVMHTIFKKGANGLLDFQVDYYSKYTARSLFGDLFVAIIIPIIASLFRSFNKYFLIDICLMGFYGICYIIITAPPAEVIAMQTLPPTPKIIKALPTLPTLPPFNSIL